MENLILTSEIIFDSKPDAVPYNYRISYKIAQICLIIFKSCSSRSGCSLVKIHIIANALNTKDSMKQLEDFVNEKLSFMIVRFDPAINRAIKYAIADGLILQLKNGTFKLSEKGKKLVGQIDKEKLLEKEKLFLKLLGTRLTNEKIESLMSLWRYKNAEN